MNKQPYAIPAEAVELCYEIKKSKFIARVAYAGNRQQAMAVLEQARIDYPDARHHCWAYLLGDPKQPTSQAFSDDGEPSGTAGKPILNVLNHRGIGDIIVVVIRYFGGIKLGAGGLVRAYSTSTQQAVETLQTKTLVPMIEHRLLCDYAGEAEIRRWLEGAEGQLVDVDYGGELQMTIALPLSMEHALIDFVAARVAVTLLTSAD
ncbi:IMPACT family member YigZ [Sinobacterium norvegicum]|uniref:IMPACT family member YigZ n=1 Tax=Sinobacterium norvegicum TaxID=1641715 RepID=A0ABM9AIT9_9GAMM|nr:YigZ family protein [Sinobacterium norvegicum]CAH0992685.1 IMPACT family member YigZ [Sinobacterium norvegicum]